MIDSLYINNFRLFKEFKITRLGMVNLIVGKNNTGKTCLLEAIRVYGTSASPRVLFDIIKERGQDWETKTQQTSNEQLIAESEHPLRYLFFGYRFPEIGKDPIEIGLLTHSEKRLKLNFYAYKLVEREGRRVITPIDDNKLENELDEFRSVIELEQNGKRNPLIHLDREPRDYFRLFRLSSLYNCSSKMIVQIVPTKNINDRKIALLWDNINVYPDLRIKVFEGLRLIDDKIQEIVLVGREKDIEFILIYNGIDERIPLKSLGDGVIHLFHILLAVVNSREGIVLIDEFENGLHYSIQPEVWKFVFQLARTLMVQVFATTHSWDCVNAFQKAAQQSSVESMLIHLGRSRKVCDKGKIIATEYDKNELTLASQADLEVR